MKSGILIRGGSFWIGAHYSRKTKRLCINILPCVTIWIVYEGGLTPKECDNMSFYPKSLLKDLTFLAMMYGVRSYTSFKKNRDIILQAHEKWFNNAMKGIV